MAEAGEEGTDPAVGGEAMRGEGEEEAVRARVVVMVVVVVVVAEEQVF